MTALIFAFVVLAVYRVSVILALDEGPFSVLDALRAWIAPDQNNWLGRGIRCVACISFWLALGAALILRATWIEWLAIAGGALALHKAVNH